MAAEAHLSGGIVDFHLDEKAAQAALRPLPTSTREMFNEPPLCASPPHRAGWGVRWPWVELVKGQPSLQRALPPRYFISKEYISMWFLSLHVSRPPGLLWPQKAGLRTVGLFL